MEDDINNKINIIKNKIINLKNELFKYEKELQELENVQKIIDETKDKNEKNRNREVDDIRKEIKDKQNDNIVEVTYENGTINDELIIDQTLKEIHELDIDEKYKKDMIRIIKNEEIKQKPKQIDDIFVKTKDNLKSHGINIEITKDDIEIIENMNIITKFNKDNTERYSRHIINDKIGINGQEKILNSSVLVIGCGGIGSTIIQYLASVGIGRIGLVDYDNVEISNLQRQIVHNMNNIGKSKVNSAKEFIYNINNDIIVDTYNILINSNNINNIIIKYDIVLDASDNIPTRYLINDACLLYNKPLISGSALELQGQLCIYNYKERPCYRCIYPTPPPVETLNNCNETGVLGPVPGLIGILQCIECIKLIIGIDVINTFLIYDAESTKFLNINLRKRNDNCICSNRTNIKLIDYELFCNTQANDHGNNISILNEKDHIDILIYKQLFNNIKHILIDIRNNNEYNMIKLNNSINIEINNFNNYLYLIKKYKFIFIICRKGNDSQKACLILKKLINNKNYFIKNIKLGYYGWHKYIDNNIPLY